MTLEPRHGPTCDPNDSSSEHLLYDGRCPALLHSLRGLQLAARRDPDGRCRGAGAAADRLDRPEDVVRNKQVGVRGV